MLSEKGRPLLISGIVIGVLGSICFSTKAIFVKLAYRESSVDAITLLALRMLISLPFFLVSAAYASSKENNQRFSNRQWLYVALVGCLGYYVSSFLDFQGLRFISAGMERLVLFIYPTIVLLISAFFLRQRITRVQWLAVIATYCGLLVAFYGEASFQQVDSSFIAGSVLIFGCAITYALYIVGSGQLIPLLGASKFNSYAMTFAAVAVLTHYFCFSSGSLLGQPAEVYVYSGLMAIVSTVIPSYLVAESIRRIGSGNTAIVASIGPVSTIIQAYFFLQEPIHVTQILGTLLIIGGVLLIRQRK
ncbi:MAG TPA: DMT family transporter [Chryseolinea sp.]|nr:DMT family transporter [Chryseolinea sp.]